VRQRHGGCARAIDGFDDTARSGRRWSEALPECHRSAFYERLGRAHSRIARIRNRSCPQRSSTDPHTRPRPSDAFAAANERDPSQSDREAVETSGNRDRSSRTERRQGDALLDSVGLRHAESSSSTSHSVARRVAYMKPEDLALVLNQPGFRATSELLLYGRSRLLACIDRAEREICVEPRDAERYALGTARTSTRSRRREELVGGGR